MTLPALPFALPKDADEILDRRAEILSAAIDADGAFSCVPAVGIYDRTLRFLFDMYDRMFFDGFLTRSYPDFRLSLSPRLLSAAGKFIVYRKSNGGSYAEIRMSSDFLTRLEYGLFSLNGLTATLPQEAFLIVFEHELCHAAEHALRGKTDHGKAFQLLAFRLFGHTETTHALPTRRQEAADRGLTVGAKVSFLCDDRELRGVISYIGKTATVMVQSATGEYRDQRGLRYAKYRVPLSLLKKR